MVGQMSFEIIHLLLEMDSNFWYLMTVLRQLGFDTIQSKITQLDVFGFVWIGIPDILLRDETEKLRTDSFLEG